MKAELTRRMEMGPTHPDYVAGTKQWLEPGTVLEHPESYKLVQMGVAKPADDECVKAAGMDAAKMKAATQAYKRLEAGIAPEDFAAFDAGEMLGYDEDGEWIPGPNYVEPVDEDDD